MEQEDKELLLKDLCARLPYKVIVHIKLNHNIHNIEYNSLLHGFMLSENVCISQLDGYTKFINLNEDEVKPYLRPMSSMTEEEEILFRCELPMIAKTDAQLVAIRMELFLKGHLDFNHLIEKGLALEAPEDMYNTK